jgi:ribosomal protein S18 acetylase RimI-like enzyme
MTDWILGPATRDEADGAAALIYRTGPKVFDYLFGGKEAARDVVAHHWIAPEGLYSFAIATLARQGSTVLGLVQGFAASEMAAQNAATIERARESLDADEFAALEMRAGVLSGLFAEAPPDAFYIEHLAVSPGARHNGCGRALMHHCFQVARAQGLSTVQLDVLADSPAVAFYRLLGMESGATQRDPLLARDHGIAGMMRMTKQLTTAD